MCVDCSTSCLRIFGRRADQGEAAQVLEYLRSARGRCVCRAGDAALADSEAVVRIPPVAESGVMMLFRTVLVVSAAAAVMWGGRRSLLRMLSACLAPRPASGSGSEIVDSGNPDALAFFGPTVSVQEMIKFVQINCSDDPIIPTPPAP